VEQFDLYDKKQMFLYLFQHKYLIFNLLFLGVGFCLRDGLTKTVLIFSTMYRIEFEKGVHNFFSTHKNKVYVLHFVIGD